MTRENLRFTVGIVTAVAAPILTAIVLFHALPKGAHEAAVVLTTLAWQHVGTVLRSLFPAPETEKERQQ